MKKLLTAIAILLFFSFGFTTNAQPYLVDGSVWKDFRGGCQNGCWHDIFTTYLSGDTLIDNQNYHIAFVYREEIHTTDSTTVTDTVFLEARYFLREEGKKFYAMEEGFDQEFLLVDFDLQLGDTVEHVWCQGHSSIVRRIDSLQVGDRRLAMYVLQSQWAIIEGVGSTAGLINGPCGLHGFTRTLECFKIGDDLFDDWLTISRDCDIDINLITSTISVETQESIQAKLFPNPASTQLNIQLEGAQLQQIDIHDLYGRPLSQMQKEELPIAERGSIYRLNVSQWPEGIYHVRLQTDKGIVTAIFKKHSQLE